jgi:anthranilate phosphoribosyltransferase
VVGVFAAEWTERLALVLHELGSHRAWVVHADDGLDELSTMGPTQISELQNGRVHTWRFDPSSAGLAEANLSDLQVHGVPEAAAALMDVLNGEAGAKRDIALLNAAAALVVAGVCDDVKTGLGRAAQAIDDGSARRTLDALVRSSQSESTQSKST